MVGWHHRLNEHESEQILRDGEGQGRLVCFGPWGCKESDTGRLNTNHKGAKAAVCANTSYWGHRGSSSSVCCAQK